MTKQKYWCLLADAFPESMVVSDNPVLTTPIEFVKARRVGDHIVLARWDAASNVGNVSALGIVIKSGPTAIEIDWRPERFPLVPEPGGQQHWKKASFCFSDPPAKRYQLARHFAEQFAELEPPSPKPKA